MTPSASPTTVYITPTSTLISTPTPTPTPTSTPAPAPAPTPTPLDIANEYEASSYVLEYLYGLATTYHGKQVFAALSENSYQGNCYENPNGSWQVSIYWKSGIEYQYPIVAPIFKEKAICGPYQEQNYCTCWLVNTDGTVRPDNGNAIRLEAEVSL